MIQSVVLHGDWVSCGKLRLSVQQVCPCPRLSSVQSHISRRHVPPRPSCGSPWKFQNKTAEGSTEGEARSRRPARGREGDYGGLFGPSLILHFSSPQHLLSLPMSCQNMKRFHPKTSVSIALRPRWWCGRFKQLNYVISEAADHLSARLNLVLQR